MIHIKNQTGKMPARRRLIAFFCLLVGLGIMSGCSRETEGTIYLSGTSMFKITAGSSSGVKEAEALNKAGKPLLEDLKWKGQPETEVLDSLVQKMQGEEAKKIYIDVLSTDKSWVAGEIQKLSEFFSEDTYESTIPVEIRSASDLDGSKSQTGERESDLAETDAEESGSEPESSVSQESSTAEPTMTEPATAESTTAEPTTAEPTTVEPATAEPTTARPTAATTAEPTRARPTEAATAAVPRTTAPESTTAAVPETAAPETMPPETAETAPETTVPETAAPSTEGEALNSGNGEATAATRSRNSDVYIPTKTIEDDQSFGPGW